MKTMVCEDYGTLIQFFLGTGDVRCITVPLAVENYPEPF